MPGGVSSPVRSFASVGGTPFFVKKGRGATVIDADGNRYVDWVMSYGPLVFGHAHGPILSAVRRALPRGTSYGAPTRGEVELAERVTKAFPSMEKVRFVSSGTEATMSAVRLARGATGRDLVLKFAGCYHGHADSFLVSAGSGVATLGIPGSPGVPASLAGLTLTARYNDLASVEALFAAHPKRIAVIAVEPVAANMGVVAPAPGFLEGLRAIANREGALLLFDEVITGFRVAKGGAQELYGVRADLTCLGKILGGGLPVGAYGGRADLMAKVAPDGPVYQAGTLSGNPLAMAAGKAMLDSLTPAVYAKLEKTAGELERGMNAAARKARRPGPRRDQPRGVDPHAVLHGRSGPELRRREKVRPRGVPEVVPRAPRERGFRRPGAVRGDVRVDRAHASRHRGHREGARDRASGGLRL